MKFKVGDRVLIAPNCEKLEDRIKILMEKNMLVQSKEQTKKKNYLEASDILLNGIKGHVVSPPIIMMKI
jgi:hypothetical protein